MLAWINLSLRMTALMEEKYNYKEFSRDPSITSGLLLFTNIATTKGQLYQSLKVTKIEHLVGSQHKIGSKTEITFQIIKHF
jgi:hypothetical protein